MESKLSGLLWLSGEGAGPPSFVLLPPQEWSIYLGCILLLSGESGDTGLGGFLLVDGGSRNHEHGFCSAAGLVAPCRGCGVKRCWACIVFCSCVEGWDAGPSGICRMSGGVLLLPAWSLSLRIGPSAAGWCGAWGKILIGTKAQVFPLIQLLVDWDLLWDLRVIDSPPPSPISAYAVLVGRLGHCIHQCVFPQQPHWASLFLFLWPENRLHSPSLSAACWLFRVVFLSSTQSER